MDAECIYKHTHKSESNKNDVNYDKEFSFILSTILNISCSLVLQRSDKEYYERKGEERASLAGFTGVGLRIVSIGHLALLDEHRGQHDL